MVAFDCFSLTLSLIFFFFFFDIFGFWNWNLVHCIFYFDLDLLHIATECYEFYLAKCSLLFFYERHSIMQSLCHQSGHNRGNFYKPICLCFKNCFFFIRKKGENIVYIFIGLFRHDHLPFILSFYFCLIHFCCLAKPFHQSLSENPLHFIWNNKWIVFFVNRECIRK